MKTRITLLLAALVCPSQLQAQAPGSLDKTFQAQMSTNFVSMKLTFFSRLLKTLSFAGSACALAPLTTFPQDATTTIGRWLEGSDPRVVAEQIGGSTLEMVVRRGGNADRSFTVNWETTDTGTATPGSNFLASGGTLTFAAGQIETVVQVRIFGDGLLEYPETIPSPCR